MIFRNLSCALILILASVTTSHAALTGIMLPPSSGTAPKHLLILLHGYGSNAQDLLPLADWIPEDTLLISLTAPISLGHDRHAWYRHVTAEHDILSAGEQVEQRLTQLQQQFQISPANTVVGGFSQGAVVSWQLALTHPQNLGGVALFSGRLPDKIQASFERSALPKIFIGHGIDDKRIPIKLAEQAADYAKTQGYSVALHRYPAMQHEISRVELQDFKQWLINLNLQK